MKEKQPVKEAVQNKRNLALFIVGIILFSLVLIFLIISFLKSFDYVTCSFPSLWGTETRYKCG